MSLALIGAGAMGGAIGARLCAVGQPLRVFDLDAEKVAALVALGAEAAPSAADAARGADAVEHVVADGVVLPAHWVVQRVGAGVAPVAIQPVLALGSAGATQLKQLAAGQQAGLGG